LAAILDACAATLAPGAALAAPDTGSAGFVGALAAHQQRRAVFVRDVEKRYLISYGADPASDQPLLSGGWLRPGTPVQLVDDFVYTGQTLVRAAHILRGAGLVVDVATVMVGDPPTIAAQLSDGGLSTIHVLVAVSDLRATI
jgi:adenine/guanine phosphoribosyltransferase-like PRPP-binding protein